MGSKELDTLIALTKDIESGNVRIEDICVVEKDILLSNIRSFMKDETGASSDYRNLSYTIGISIKNKSNRSNQIPRVNSNSRVAISEMATDENTHFHTLSKLANIISKIKEC